MSELWIVGAAYRIVGRSGPDKQVVPPGAWTRRARHRDGSLVPSGGHERLIEPDRKEDWNAGCYDILEPLYESATGFTLTVPQAESATDFITTPPKDNQAGELSPAPPIGHTFCSHPPEGNEACDRDRTKSGPVSIRIRDRGLTWLADEVLTLECKAAAMELRWRGAIDGFDFEQVTATANEALRFYQRKTREAGENLTLINQRIVKALDEVIAMTTTRPEEAIAALRLIKDALVEKAAHEPAT
jgi:hypothetical protein